MVQSALRPAAKRPVPRAGWELFDSLHLETAGRPPGFFVHDGAGSKAYGKRQATQIGIPMDHEPAPIGCPGCSSCPADDCPPDHDRDARLLSGWRLALAWIGVGLGPIVLAIAASAWSGEDPGAQLAAGLSALAVGMIISVVVARRLRPNEQSGSPAESV